MKRLVLVLALLALPLVVLAVPAPKIEICHLTGSETNPWVEIEINENAWSAHVKHGDFKVDATHTCPPLQGQDVPEAPEVPAETINVDSVPDPITVPGK